MKPHALTTTLCLAALAAACPAVGGFKEPRQATGFTRDGALAHMLNVALSVTKVDRASNRVVRTLAAPALPTPAHPST